MNESSYKVANKIGGDLLKAHFDAGDVLINAMRRKYQKILHNLQKNDKNAIFRVYNLKYI